jgi:hypothetical protein
VANTDGNDFKVFHHETAGEELFLPQLVSPSVAAVASARRLAGVLYAMWRDGVPYDAAQLAPRSARGQQRAG